MEEAVDSVAGERHIEGLNRTLEEGDDESPVHVISSQPRSRLIKKDVAETSMTILEPILTAREIDLPMPKIFTRLSTLHLHHEWMTESWSSGSYRYLHYSGYGGDGLKIFDAQIETSYDTQLAWCLRCWPRTVRVRVTDTSGADILIIELTGRLGAHPIDTADLRLPCGHRFATLKWNVPCFEVYNMDDERMLVMKWPRCVICSLSGDYTITAGDGKTPLGTIDASYSLMGPQWKGEEVLHTYLPESLDPRLKAAWLSLMFMLRLGCGGRQHAKVVTD